MRTMGIFVTLTVIFLAGILLSVIVLRTDTETKVDLVAVNEIMKTVEQHWGSLDEGDLNLNHIQQPFTVLDLNGQPIFHSSPDATRTINEALKNRDTIVDIQIDNAIVGKLIIPCDDQQTLKAIKIRLAIILFIAFTLLAILCVLYAAFLNRTIFRPFRELQAFAANVARGKLDVPLTMSQDNPFGAFTESFDIMREELAAARQSEYEANRSKKELVASLSHDIKTPVASIKAVSELMLLKATDEKMQKQLNTIYAKAEQINLLVTDMFHATLEELNELKVATTEELSSVLYGMINSVNIHDQIHCEPIPDCMIVTDVHRLQQVLDNIVSNAYKYANTPITITSRLTAQHLELHIADNGPGIPEDELPLLFNKFYRGSNAEGRSGSGLGLYISKYLMQRMQGDIACRNREGGFTVTVTIPLA
ncbi:HAMP domain-containing sensor histidine kinase [Paenibacillus soyae]|uniref:histidine kinase n=1 Tax=Paenibacillus soyae TaxID=2969249 RepID=A0A9X2S857_9BACL|nr:HAMP domain-containing sensor histidine kinase [Paenibacillus soyae]MCR2804004.1 HAMP domain-containing histidine kinase [Paenibacillus soyae]